MGFERDVHHRLGEGHGFEHHRTVGIAQGVAGGRGLQAHETDDIPGLDHRHILALIGMDANQSCHALTLVLNGIERGVTRLEAARIDPHEGQLPHERVRHDLEGEARKGFVCRRGTLHHHPGAVGLLGVESLDGRQFAGGRKIVHDGVEQRLYAFVAEGGSAQHGHHFVAHRGLVQKRTNFVGSERAPVEVPFHHGIIGIRDRIEHCLAGHCRGFAHVLGDVANGVFRTVDALVVDHGLHFDQVNNTAETGFLADRKLHRHRTRTQPAPDLTDHAIEIRAGAIHLVDERHARNLVFRGLAPHRFGLGLHPAHGTEHHDPAVQNPKAPFDFHREVHVSWGVDDVDLATFP